jgi:hypothetical protein
LSIRRELDDFELELADNGDVPPSVYFFGVAPGEVLLDVICAASRPYGDGLEWSVDERGVVFGSGPGIDEPVVGVLDFSPLSEALFESEEIGPDKIFDLVREFMYSETWDLSDAYHLDILDASRLVVIHTYRAQLDIVEFLNRILDCDARHEQEFRDYPDRMLDTTLGTSVDGLSPLAAFREIGRRIGLPVQITVDDTKRLADLDAPMPWAPDVSTVGDVFRAIAASSDWHASISGDRIMLSDEAPGPDVVIVVYDTTGIELDDLPGSRRTRDFKLLPSGTDAESFTEGLVEADPVPWVAYDTLELVIRDNIAPDYWTGDPNNNIVQLPGRLVVKAVPGVHRQIRAFLESSAEINPP